MAGSRERAASPATPEAPSSYSLETDCPRADSNPERNWGASDHHANDCPHVTGKLATPVELAGIVPAPVRPAIGGARRPVEVDHERFPEALEPFLDAFVDLIVEDLLANPPPSKP
jgi:hypothetical protein